MEQMSALGVPLRTITAIVSKARVDASISNPVCRTKLASAVTSVTATTIPKRTQHKPSLPSPKMKKYTIANHSSK